MNRLIVIAPLALAACNSQPAVNAKNASVAQVAAQVKAANQQIKIEPGLWSHQTELLAFDLPGMKDPRMAAIMKQSMAKAQDRVVKHCVTPEEANKPDMFATHDNGACRYDHFTMGGGKIDAAMTCQGRDGQPGKMSMAMSGSYSSTAYDMTVEMKGGDPNGPMGVMNMKAHTKGMRIGDCQS